MSKSFNKQAILEVISVYVDEGITLENIQEFAFCSDPWIFIEASEALKNFDEQDQLYEKTELNGVSGAIQYVQDYENAETIGGIGGASDLSNPEEVASKVVFINGEQIINELAEALNIDLEDKLTEQQTEQLSSAEAMQELLKNKNHNSKKF